SPALAALTAAWMEVKPAFGAWARSSSTSRTDGTSRSSRASRRGRKPRARRSVAVAVRPKSLLRAAQRIGWSFLRTRDSGPRRTRVPPGGGAHHTVRLFMREIPDQSGQEEGDFSGRRPGRGRAPPAAWAGAARPRPGGRARGPRPAPRESAAR